MKNVIINKNESNVVIYLTSQSEVDDILLLIKK